jgi:hypothetical protein
MADFKPYLLKIEQNRLIQNIKTHGFGTLTQPITLNLAMMAAFAAHLIRCAGPAARARGMEYPTQQIKESFLRFAETLEPEIGPLERLSMLASLREDPLLEMKRLRLFDLDTLKTIVEALLSGNKKGQMGAIFEKIFGHKLPVPVWTPFLPSETFIFWAEKESSASRGKK